MSLPSNIVVDDTARASTTKAGWLWQALNTDRDFCATYFDAILEHDVEEEKLAAIADALEIIDMSPDDGEISEEEYLTFARGLTPSGVLEVTAWGGYYLTDSPFPDGIVFALLICSSNNCVYWGPEASFAEKYWSRYQVDYHLEPNATLGFSSLAGEVVLSFSRDYDEETGNFGKTTVKGTVGDIAISAAQSIPSILLNEASSPNDGLSLSNISSFNNASPLDHASSFNTTDTSNNIWNDNFLLSDGYKTYAAVAGIVGTAMGVVGFCCPDLRRRWIIFTQELRYRTHDMVRYCRRLGEARLAYTQVDLSEAQKDLEEKVVGEINEKLKDIDFKSETVEEVIARLRLESFATEVLEESIRSFLREELAIKGRRFNEDIPKLVDLETGKVVPEWVKKGAEDGTDVLMDKFEQDVPAIKAIVRFTAYECRKEFFRNEAQGLVTRIADMDAVIEWDRKEIRDRESQVERMEREAKRLREDGKNEEAKDVERAIKLLDDEIAEKSKKLEEEKAERNKLDRDRKDVEHKRDEHDKNVEEQKEEWDKKAKGHIKW